MEDVSFFPFGEDPLGRSGEPVGFGHEVLVDAVTAARLVGEITESTLAAALSSNMLEAEEAAEVRDACRGGVNVRLMLAARGQYIPDPEILNRLNLSQVVAGRSR